MKYEQRDIVEINFVFPDGTSKPHPALIVSNNELQMAEKQIGAGNSPGSIGENP